MSLDKLRELVDKASGTTPGPWLPCLGSGEHIMTGIHSDARNGLIADFCPDYFLEKSLSQARPEEWANIQFTCAARNSIPDLESLLSRHEALKEAMRELAVKMHAAAAVTLAAGTKTTIAVGEAYTTCARELEALAEKQP